MKLKEKQTLLFHLRSFQTILFLKLRNKFGLLNLGIKKVSQYILSAGKSAIYAASRLSVYYSNSIVPGGLLVRSYMTRFTPFTSFTIRFMTFCSTSHGISAASAVMKSLVSTARRATA